MWRGLTMPWSSFVLRWLQTVNWGSVDCKGGAMGAGTLIKWIRRVTWAETRLISFALSCWNATTSDLTFELIQRHLAVGVWFVWRPASLDSQTIWMEARQMPRLQSLLYQKIHSQIYWVVTRSWTKADVNWKVITYDAEPHKVQSEGDENSCELVMKSHVRSSAIPSSQRWWWKLRHAWWKPLSARR
jgi:hypothetical protein